MLVQQAYLDGGETEKLLLSLRSLDTEAAAREESGEPVEFSRHLVS